MESRLLEEPNEEQILIKVNRQEMMLACYTHLNGCGDKKWTMVVFDAPFSFYLGLQECSNSCLKNWLRATHYRLYAILFSFASYGSLSAKSSKGDVFEKVV